jgi:hypothetical protein
MSANKVPSTKVYSGSLGPKGNWSVRYGYLKGKKRAGKTQNLFQFVAEKIPFDFLADLQRRADEYKIERNGVYIAHDSMG